MTIQNVFSYCSNETEFTNVGGTNRGNLDKAEGWPIAENDVWFKFTAARYDVNIKVTGSNGNSATLSSPLVALYISDDCLNYEQVIGSVQVSGNITTLYKGGLTIGNVYYIRVSAANNATGTFQLCLNNYNPVLQSGQDCSSASYLCSKESFTQNNMTGAGANNRESAGTCMDPGNDNRSIEANTAWYKWTAANNGTLIFTITPTNNDDIDWVLYDLGSEDMCTSVNDANAIRCASGSGLTCNPSYKATGLSFDAIETSENSGCFPGQDGFVKFIDMQQGHVYALLINNFSNGNNGFTMDFDGTGEFLGPKSSFNYSQTDPCSANQAFTFTNTSSRYDDFKWSFGDGAYIIASPTNNSFVVKYRNPGVKTVTLEVVGENRCSVIQSQSITVGIKPEAPEISANQTKFCFGDTLKLSSVQHKDALFYWTGPNGFLSVQTTVTLPIRDNSQSGVYQLTVTLYGCSSDVSSIVVLPFGKKPVANFEVLEKDPCSAQQSYTITNRSTDFVKLQWDFGENAITSESTASGPFSISYTTPGEKIIRLEAEGVTGCITTMVKTINVPSVLETPVIESNQAVFCANDTIRLSAQALEAVTYNWTGPNNFISDQPVIYIPAKDNAVSGTYYLSTSNGKCKTQEVSVVVPPIKALPIADFSTEPGFFFKLAKPINIQFYNHSTGGNSYLWDFGDGKNSTEPNPIHTFNSAGEFEITLTAFKDSVCSASVKKGTFVIKDDNALFIPNTFTPNGDGINDEFNVTITNLKAYRIAIFNRYGTSLFQSVDIFENWKGTFNDQPVPIGTYYYVIEAMDANGNPYKKGGSITVVR